MTTSGAHAAAAIGALVSGLLGLATVLVFPTLAFLLGVVALAAGAWARRGGPSYRTAATVGLVLGAIAVVAVLLVVVFLSGSWSGQTEPSILGPVAVSMGRVSRLGIGRL